MQTLQAIVQKKEEVAIEEERRRVQKELTKSVKASEIQERREAREQRAYEKKAKKI